MKTLENRASVEWVTNLRLLGLLLTAVTYKHLLV